MIYCKARRKNESTGCSFFEIMKEGDRMPLKDKRGLLIANARAGKQGAKLLLYPIVEGLASEYTLTIHMTEGPGDARATAMQADGFDALFVSGGDGTINNAVSGLIEAGIDIPVGYYPSGTANDLATTLGYSRESVENSKKILGGTPTPHDVGILNGRYHFLYTASFGAFTKVSYDTPQDLKNVFGQAAYILSGAAEVFNLEPERVSVKWDNGELLDTDVFFFGVMNTHSMGGVLKISPERTDLSDGLLDLLIIKKPKTLAEMNNTVIDLLRNNLYDSTNENIVFAHTANVEVTMERPVTWTVDGEGTIEMTEATIRTIPDGVKFIR